MLLACEAEPSLTVFDTPGQFLTLGDKNGLFFAAAAATNGMPMIVELGIGLDVLVGSLILGVFMFQIREQFDSLDIHHLEKLKDD